MLYAKLSGVSESITKNGSPYLMGQIEFLDSLGSKIPFRWWGVSQESANLPDNNLVCVEGTRSQYQGADQFTLSSALPDPDHSKADYIQDDPFNERNWDYANRLLDRVLSPQARKVATFFLEENGDRFREEYAGCFIHDAHKGGLLWHSFKVTFLLEQLSLLQPQLFDKLDRDAMFLGCFFHDLGKIWEYDLGDLTMDRLVSHRVLMIEYLAQHKDFLVSTIGEDSYRIFQAVIAQHHGEFEERCRIVEAQLVHMCDVMDATVTRIDDLLTLPRFEGNRVKVNQLSLE